MNKELDGSDKHYWHRFIPFYEDNLKYYKTPVNILEFGVFKGDSIRWLKKKYPFARIYGCDILPVQEEWPVEDLITYKRIDQSSYFDIVNLFNQIGSNLDLIIEDGSHFPEHQRNCLVAGLKYLNSGGHYILEDLHTSMPKHPLYFNTILSRSGKIKLNAFNLLSSIAKLFGLSTVVRKYFLGKNLFVSPFHLLITFEHMIESGLELDELVINELSTRSLFKKEDVIFLYSKIKSIKIYRRGTLPIKCFNCGTMSFDYSRLTCKCGLDVYSDVDSIAAIIEVK